MALRAVPEHPKFAALQSILHLRKSETMGLLEMLWHFTGKYAPQGNCGKFKDVEIESWIDWGGERGRLIEALVETGWLDRSAEHRLLVHDWHEHADTTTRKYLGRKQLPFLTNGGPCLGSVLDMSGTSTSTLPDMSCGIGKVSSPPEPVPVPAPEPGAGPVPEEKQVPSPPAPAAPSETATCG